MSKKKVIYMKYKKEIGIEISDTLFEYNANNAYTIKLWW